MGMSIYDVKRELTEIHKKLMELSNPGTVSESNDEFKERKIEMANAAARIMQGKCTGG